jgi:hypothetical protein
MTKRYVITLRELQEYMVPGRAFTLDLDDQTHALEQAHGAIPNGTTVRKIKSLPSDYQGNGALGTVRGSVGPAFGRFGYFVEWEDVADVMTFITGERIEVAAR